MKHAELIARLEAAWNEREKTFPPFTRMRFSQATPMARIAILRALDSQSNTA